MIILQIIDVHEPGVIGFISSPKLSDKKCATCSVISNFKSRVHGSQLAKGCLRRLDIPYSLKTQHKHKE